MILFAGSEQPSRQLSTRVSSFINSWEFFHSQHRYFRVTSLFAHFTLNTPFWQPQRDPDTPKKLNGAQIPSCTSPPQTLLQMTISPNQNQTVYIFFKLGFPLRLILGKFLADTCQCLRMPHKKKKLEGGVTLSVVWSSQKYPSFDSNFEQDVFFVVFAVWVSNFPRFITFRSASQKCFWHRCSFFLKFIKYIIRLFMKLWIASQVL